MTEHCLSDTILLSARAFKTVTFGFRAKQHCSEECRLHEAGSVLQPKEDQPGQYVSVSSRHEQKLQEQETKTQRAEPAGQSTSLQRRIPLNSIW